MNKEYNPTPVYNRKFMRGVIRAQVIRNNGYHNVSATMSHMFKRMRNHAVEATNDNA